MKIKKNLSDEDMFQGVKEEKSFETAVYHDSAETVHSKRSEKKSQEEQIPEVIRERLNQLIISLGLEWLKQKKGPAVWKIIREQDKIIIWPEAAQEKDGKKHE